MKKLRIESESGMSMVELIVYMVLSMIVLTIVANLWISGVRTEKSVTTVTTSTTAAQLATEAIQRGVRNASGFVVTKPSGDDQFLVMRTAGGDTNLTWNCQAWYYSADQRSLRTKTIPTQILAPTTAQLGSWLLVAEGVSPVSGTQVFTARDTRLAIEFHVDAGDRPPVLINSSALSRTMGGETDLCN